MVNTQAPSVPDGWRSFLTDVIASAGLCFALRKTRQRTFCILVLKICFWCNTSRINSPEPPADVTRGCWGYGGISSKRDFSRRQIVLILRDGGLQNRFEKVHGWIYRRRHRWQGGVMYFLMGVRGLPRFRNLIQPKKFRRRRHIPAIEGGEFQTPSFIRGAERCLTGFITAPVRRLETTFRLLINTLILYQFLWRKWKGRNHDQMETCAGWLLVCLNLFTSSARTPNREVVLVVRR